MLLAPHSQDAPGKFLIADHEPIKKMLAWALKTYPIIPLVRSFLRAHPM